MVVTFFDRQDPTNPLNGSTFAGSTEALAVLDAYRAREPFFCELIGSNGSELTVGLGGPLGCVQLSSPGHTPPYLVATRAGVSEDKRNVQGVEYVMGNEPTPVHARHCLPWDTVREIIAHFVETGGTNPAVPWEEI